MDAGTLASIATSTGVGGSVITYAARKLWQAAQASANFTAALQANTKAADNLAGRIDTLTVTIDDHGRRLAVLEAARTTSSGGESTP